MSLGIPPEATGLRLCKVTKAEELILCEEVQFVAGAAGVDTVLRRAQISGKVGPVGETGDYWADLMDRKGDWIETVALDRQSYGALKNRWARCRVQHDEE